MAIITQDGLFYGDRVKQLSDMAQLYWPRFFVASNTLARLELNYEKLCTTAFTSLRLKPTYEEFWGYVGEFYTAHLLFTYDCEGQIWGQWDTPKELLPRHTLKTDERSPKPPEDAYAAWIEKYKQKKHDNRPKVFDVTCFVLPAKNCEKVSKDSEILHKVSRGVGVGVGVGVGKARQGEAKANTAQALPDWIPLPTWNDFVEMRKKIRKPLTEAAQVLIVKKLENLQTRGHPVKEVLEQSILNSYQGVWEIGGGKVDGNHGDKHNRNTERVNRHFADGDC